MEALPDGPWYYEQIELGFNYRMTDMQAALGLAQLRRLDEFVSRRRELSRRYDELLSGLPLSVPWQVDDIESSRHLYVIRLHLKELNVGRTQVFRHLRESGIGVNVHYIPVHTQPFYQRLGFKEGDFPESEHYYREAISLPMYSSLTAHDQDEVVRALRAATEQSA
jgi:dTDP-4-amino-4,6-dideoxygalactose transaminase